MYWDMYHHRVIQVEGDATRANQKALSASEQVERLEDKVDSLALICQAMWELLNDHLTEPDAQLFEKVREIDLRDGKLDGKMNRVDRTCSECDRMLHARHRRCMYCGHEMPRENLFQA